MITLTDVQEYAEVAYHANQARLNMRDAALRMQIAVAKVLENGGTNNDLWWEDLVEAQQRLAGQTNGSRNDFEILRQRIEAEKQKARD